MLCGWEKGGTHGDGRQEEELQHVETECAHWGKKKYHLPVILYPTVHEVIDGCREGSETSATNGHGLWATLGSQNGTRHATSRHGIREIVLCSILLNGEGRGRGRVTGQQKRDNDQRQEIG